MKVAGLHVEEEHLLWNAFSQAFPGNFGQVVHAQQRFTVTQIVPNGRFVDPRRGGSHALANSRRSAGSGIIIKTQRWGRVGLRARRSSSRLIGGLVSSRRSICAMRGALIGLSTRRVTVGVPGLRLTLRSGRRCRWLGRSRRRPIRRGRWSGGSVAMARL